MNFEIPLQRIFIELQKSGFLLGIDEYYDAIELIRLGFGFEMEKGILDQNELLNICKTLWFTPNQSFSSFEYIFNTNFKNYAIKQTTNEETINPNPNPVEKKIPETKDKKENPIQKTENPSEINKENTSSQKTTSNANNQLIKYVLNTPTDTDTEIKLKDKGTVISRKFLFGHNYFPISNRQLQQIFSFLPLNTYVQKNNRIDIDATVTQIAKDGIFSGFAYEKEKFVANKVIIFTDHQGSMHAFDKMTDWFYNLLATSFSKASNNKLAIERYYFYNTIQKYCFKNPSHTEAIEINELVSNNLHKKVSIIIISDAGAARGGNSLERYKATIRFMFPLKKITSKMVWLNPMPENRWEDTTAELIQSLVPMYCLHSIFDLQNAVSTLRGKKVVKNNY